MITKKALDERMIPFSSLRSTTEAFIDYCIPESSPKRNYAIVGPGVSQGGKQPVSLREPHGFQVGGVSMPHGKVNPPHMHFTCEVFICARGDWKIQWGFNPEVSSAQIGEGDMISVPTWIYRGFTNVGVDDGFLFTALGGDRTGGVLWSPDTLDAAARNGVYLTDGYRMIDERRGEQLTPDMKRLQPMTACDMAALRTWSPQQMSGRIVRFADLQWSSRALLDAALPGCGAQIAPAVGLGISEDRDALASVSNAHGVSIEWLRIPAGGRVSRHRLHEKQVLIVKAGRLELGIETADGPASYALDGAATAWDTFAIPGGCWRTMSNRGEGDALALLMTAGDHRKRIAWAPEVVAAAAAIDVALDADGCVGIKRYIDRAQP